MELRIMPLFTDDSVDDETIKEQLKWVVTVYNFYKFRLNFWPYSAKNSNNTIPLKGLNSAANGDIVALWGGASRLYGGQVGYIVPVIFGKFTIEGLAGRTAFVGQGVFNDLAPGRKPICTVNTAACTLLTTAHEIGHAAGLPDLQEPKTVTAEKDRCKAADCRNLMYGTGTYRISYALNDQQLAQIARSGFTSGGKYP
jgi:hypothetical protein